MPNNKVQRAVKNGANKNQKAKAVAGKDKQAKEPSLQRQVRKHPHFEIMENGKIRCVLTQHQFLPTLDNFNSYLKSKSYKRGIESQFDLTDYQEFLVTHKDNPHFLFCRLTGAKLPKKKTAIEKHVNSRRFKIRHAQILQEMAKREAKEEEGDLEEVQEQQEEEQQDFEDDEEEEEQEQAEE